MANSRKQHYYVQVITNDGPAFVTKVEYSSKDAWWIKADKPLEFNKSMAEDLVLGLSLNGYVAYVVSVPYELTNQPYHYDLGHFEWVMNEEEK